MDVVRNSKRVLAVDDEDIRDIHEINLTAAGYEVKQAEDGDDALSQMADWLPDVMVLDVSMPLMDGWEVANRARADPEFSARRPEDAPGLTDRRLTIGGLDQVREPMLSGSSH